MIMHAVESQQAVVRRNPTKRRARDGPVVDHVKNGGEDARLVKENLELLRSLLLVQMEKEVFLDL